MCHAQEVRRLCPHQRAQPCSAIAFVIHNRRGCIHFSARPEIQRRSLSSGSHAKLSGWPSTRSHNAPVGYYSLPKEMMAHWTKTFKSCRVLLNLEWKNVSEHFGVSPFSRSARRIPIDDLTEGIRVESRTVKAGKRRTNCTSARSKLPRHQTIRESLRSH